jgi:dipeptidyl aminopeptidase/acylaminoacyl peptidase
MGMRLSFIAVASILLCFLPASGAGLTLVSFDDYARVVRVGDPQISPDGKQIAFVVSRIDMAANKNTSEIDLVDVASGATRVLTQGRDEVGEPRWSPGGTQLAFVTLPACAEQPCKAKPQVFAFPMDGGDASQLTNAPNGVGSYAWRPDGRAIAYTTSDDPANKAAIDKHHDLFVVGDQDFLSQAAPVPSHIWMQTIGGGATRITSGSTSLGSGQFASDLSWSADGTQIAYARFPDAYSGHIGHLQACAVNVATKRVACVPAAGLNTSGPIFAPTGSALLYTEPHDGYWSIEADAYVRDGSQAWEIAPALDRDIHWAAWAPGGRGVWLAADDRATVGLWYAPLHGAPRRIGLGSLVLSEANVGRDGAMALIAASPGDPSELYYLAPNASTTRRLTDLNAWLSSRVLARTREFAWRNEGFNEDGILTYPANYARGRRYPLVLVIHGGPTQTSSPLGWNSLDQILAAHGYFVFEPNYRGSDNFGFTYGKAIVGDVDAGPGRDIVAGVKALERSLPVDSSRIGVSGWSGGGLLTSWLIGNYHIWKAAVSGAAVDDFTEEYDLTDIFDYMPSLMGGLSPWRGGRAQYLRSSPVTYAADVTTPTLILSDTGDYRVPTPQSYEFYHALKEHGKDVTFVAIPAYGHFPSDPVHQLDVFKRWVGWMDQHLR